MVHRTRLVLALCLPLLTLALPLGASPIEQHLPKISDYQAYIVVVKANHAVLSTVNKDFSQSYKLKDATVSYKEPAMIRVEGKRGLIRFANVCNGDKKRWQLGPLSGTRDLKQDPSQKQTLQDFGLVTAAQLNDHVVKFVREEKSPQGKLLVYEMRYKTPTDRTRKLIWIDPVKKIMVKRQLFSQVDGKLKLQYVYSNPKLVNGVWVPHRITVYNRELKLGAISDLKNVRVNQGLPDDGFEI